MTHSYHEPNKLTMSQPTPKPIEPPSDLTSDEALLFANPLIDGQYENTWDIMEKPKPTKLLKWKKERNPWKAQKKSPSPTPRAADPLKVWEALEAPTKIMWNGHATFMVKMDQLNLIIDPVFGSATFAVPRQQRSPLTTKNIPQLDVVLLTHGHYDHFEMGVLRALYKRYGKALLFVVPVGLDKYLPKGAKSVALSWWERITIKGVELCLTPSQHWHRRGLNDYNKALWGGWYIQGEHSIYHMGDSGYFGGFEMVRRTLGAPDVALLPMGAFEPQWFMSYQHMSPTGAFQAWQDTQARHVIPMHWGTFDLSNEPLDHGPKLFEDIIAKHDGDMDRWHPLSLGTTVGLDGAEFIHPDR